MSDRDTLRLLNERFEDNEAGLRAHLGTLKDHERRIGNLERAARRAGWQIDPVPREPQPPPDPAPPGRPDREPPRRGGTVQVSYTPRQVGDIPPNQRSALIDLGPEHVEADGLYRWRSGTWKLPVGNGKSILATAWEERLGDSEPRWTLLLENAYRDCGTAYFEDLRVEWPNSTGEVHPGRHCIVPRGYLPLRTSEALGRLDYWQHLPLESLPESPPFAAQLCREELERAGQHEKVLGPYTIGDPQVRGSSSLDGSHGGWKLEHYNGGRESWHQGCAESWELMERWMLATVCRSPIALRNEDDTLARVESPYWLGRTVQHEPPGYHDVPDEWCEYGKSLYEYRGHDGSHLWRQYGPAAQLARYDQLARHFLRATWNDVACWMFNPVGKSEGNRLLWDLATLAERAPQGLAHDRAGRDLAHVCGALHECQPYIHPGEAEEARELLRAFVLKVVVPGTGICHGRDTPEPYKPSLLLPVCRAREADLLYPYLIKTLDLPDVAADARRFMARQGTTSVAMAFEIRASLGHWTQGGFVGADYYEPYDLIRGDLDALGGLGKVMERAAGESVRENVLGMVAPSLWRSEP